MSESFPNETVVKDIQHKAFMEMIRVALLSPRAAAFEPIPYWMSPATQRKLVKEFEGMGYVTALIGEHGTQKLSVKLHPS